MANTLASLDAYNLHVASRISAARRLVSDVREKLADVKAHITDLLLQQKQLEEYIADHERTLSSINFLPPDLFSIIFLFTLPSPKELVRNLKLHDMRTLSPWLLTLQLERSDNPKLRLQLFGPVGGRLASQLAALVRASDRWSSVRLAFDWPLLLHQLAPLEECVGQLEELHIGGVWRDAPIALPQNVRLDPFTIAPRLRSLIVSRVCEPTVSLVLPWHQLTRYRGSGSAHEHISVLKFCPNLTTAHLMFESTTTVANNTSTQVSLPKLRNLKLVNSEFLSFMSLPTLETIVIEKMPPAVETLLPLLVFVRRPQTPPVLYFLPGEHADDAHAHLHPRGSSHHLYASHLAPPRRRPCCGRAPRGAYARPGPCCTCLYRPPPRDTGASQPRRIRPEPSPQDAALAPRTVRQLHMPASRAAHPPDLPKSAVEMGHQEASPHIGGGAGGGYKYISLLSLRTPIMWRRSIWVAWLVARQLRSLHLVKPPPKMIQEYGQLESPMFMPEIQRAVWGELSGIPVSEMGLRRECSWMIDDGAERSQPRGLLLRKFIKPTPHAEKLAEKVPSNIESPSPMGARISTGPEIERKNAGNIKNMNTNINKDPVKKVQSNSFMILAEIPWSTLISLHQADQVGQAAHVTAGQTIWIFPTGPFAIEPF
ncbi:hypothetical protein B0H17DRAFT_1280038 [Mycena rosella]|uniref:F-box domain-containing protein n=1 Tax=Mycena rosella TaxID=1033263 RepID=A0AAD7BYA8_MYCRO|nr:hypothetical protein B0H17DRAFT_1280038 [Mycena rosella]